MRTVQRAIKKLVDLGEIKIIRKGNGRCSSRYRLMILNAIAKVSRQGRQKAPSNSPTLKGRKKRTWARAINTARPKQTNPSSSNLALVSDQAAREVHEKWMNVTDEQVRYAKQMCCPGDWEKRVMRVARLGTPTEGQEREAARRWRADRILQRLPLATGEIA